MKIVHVICGLKIGGAELMLSDIMQAQCKLGHQVTLIVINDWVDRAVADVLSSDIKTIYISRPQGSRNPWWILKYNVMLRLEKPDVVHFHDDNALGMTMRGKSVKSVFTVHDEKLDLKYISKADHVCAISKAVRDDLLLRYKCASTLVYNGIKASDINVLDSSLPQRPFRLVQVSRLEHPKKGQDLLIEAVARLVADGLDMTLDFIGDGESYEYLKSLVNKRFLDKVVTFKGAMPRADIYKILSRYHLFVQPSRKEGFGLTIAEAMAAGVPVLVSDIAGPKEVVAEGTFGELFEADNLDALVDAIRHIYCNYDGIRKRALGLSRDYCLRMFDIESTAANYINVYGR